MTCHRRGQCSHLVGDLDAARGLRAVSDAQAQASWSAALGHLRTGGVECQRAVDGNDSVAELHAVRAMIASGDDLIDFSARLDRITGVDGGEGQSG